MQSRIHLVSSNYKMYDMFIPRVEIYFISVIK